MSKENNIPVKGALLDEQTRCPHYHSPNDIIAIRMKCCEEYYACIDCHHELAMHPAEVWPAKEFDTKAVLCGACYQELTINEYLRSNHQCPYCEAAFNPGCRHHYHLYFEMKDE
jgi:uncharacterized CHY-type Zn-finger protein